MDADRLATSLAEWLDRFTVMDAGADEVTGRIVESVAGWARGQGWRVYLRAASVLRLPPPYERQHSVLDVACARPAGPPVVIEVDRSHRQRTIDKLVAEAGAGRVALWVRWGSGGFIAPPEPIRMVPLVVRSRRAPAGSGRVHFRLPEPARPAPAHSAEPAGGATALALPVGMPLAHSEPPAS